jgi:ketosteroid isomerase-like protein
VLPIGQVLVHDRRNTGSSRQPLIQPVEQRGEPAHRHRQQAATAGQHSPRLGKSLLDVNGVLANDEHTVALCMLSASRGNKSVEFPVANVSHMRDGKITEFWGATTDPQASIDFWS